MCGSSSTTTTVPLSVLTPPSLASPSLRNAGMPNFLTEPSRLANTAFMGHGHGDTEPHGQPAPSEGPRSDRGHGDSQRPLRRAAQLGEHAGLNEQRQRNDDELIP